MAVLDEKVDFSKCKASQVKTLTPREMLDKVKELRDEIESSKKKDKIFIALIIGGLALAAIAGTIDIPVLIGIGVVALFTGIFGVGISSENRMKKAFLTCAMYEILEGKAKKDKEIEKLLFGTVNEDGDYEEGTFAYYFLEIINLIKTAPNTIVSHYNKK